MCTLLAIPSVGVTVQYEEHLYNVAEEDGSVTLALELNGDASVPVTVSVRTRDLVNVSAGDAAIGEPLSVADRFYCIRSKNLTLCAANVSFQAI